MFKASVRRLFLQSLRQTAHFREGLETTTGCLQRLKFYSTQTPVKDASGTAVSEKEAEETRIKKKLPSSNTPFIRELFLGRFTKVMGFSFSYEYISVPRILSHIMFK